MPFGPVFLIFALLIAGSWSAGPTQCTVTHPTIDWVANIITPVSIDDTQQLNLVIPFTGNVDVSTPDDIDSGRRYIEASINPADSTIVIITNAYFNQYIDEETASTTQTFIAISRTIVIKCEGTDYPLTLTQYVTDTNNQAPTFSSVTYAYTIPMPLMPKADLTSFGESVIIEDLDFSPQTIQFSIYPPDYFVLETQNLPNKQYRAILTVTEYVRFDQGQMFIITASDGVNQAIAAINITKDDSVSLPEVPRFSELVYEYIYFDTDGTPSIVPVDPSKNIIVTASDSTLVEITMTGDAVEYFTVVYDATTSTVVIELQSAIPPTSDLVLLLTLTASLMDGGSAEATIIIRLPCYA